MRAASSVPPVIAAMTSGRAERLAEERARRVERVRVEVGERVVDEAHLLEERRLVAERDLVCRAEREVVRFALSDRRSSPKHSETRAKIVQRKLKACEFAR